MAEKDTWKKMENLGNAQKVLRDYERGYEETAKRISQEEDGTYSRSELLGRYMAKLLYGWNDGKSKREYLKRLQENWRQWKGGKFFQRKNLKREGTILNALNPIKEVYDLYSDKKETPQITEIADKGLGEETDLENRLADPYLEL